MLEKLEQEEEIKKQKILKEQDKFDRQRKSILLREQEKKEKEKKALKEKLLKEKEKKENEKKLFEELLAKEKERIKKKKEIEKENNNESIDNSKNNLKLRNNNPKLRDKLYNENKTNKTSNNISKNNVFKKNITELNNNYRINNYNTLYLNRKNETSDNETEVEENTDDKKNNNNHKIVYSLGKHEKFKKVKFGDPLNPYMTNWPSSFLKIGYNVGFHFNKYEKGVPLLRIQKLKKSVEFPPLYNIQYNKYTDNKNYPVNDTGKLACNTVVKKLFTPNSTKYSFGDFKKNNKQKNIYQTLYNKTFLPKEAKENEINYKEKETKLNSRNDLPEIKNQNINENKENKEEGKKEILIEDNNNKNNIS